ncbi:hypothetical protein EPR50_G00176420 [Xyrichtys novacula]|uniref:Guanine nucleotide-binding protein subunit gamma n=1 Tax=Xyrichtys novacula TaxID=13765 RepID=A0AAV1G5K7_XYRNO|nr:hypothetical protein EPR50_G00176420 [Xyrichtys novacula]
MQLFFTFPLNLRHFVVLLFCVKLSRGAHQDLPAWISASCTEYAQEEEPNRQDSPLRVQSAPKRGWDFLFSFSYLTDPLFVCVCACVRVCVCVCWVESTRILQIGKALAHFSTMKDGIANNSTASISQARKAVEQLKMEACMDRIKVSKAAADLMAYCDAHIREDPLIIPVPASENPFREKKFFCSIL